MLSVAILLLGLLQAGQDVRPTILTKPSDAPRRNFRILYYDDAFLFAGRDYGNSNDGYSTPGLFVHSKEKSRWVQIDAISTAGGRFGKSMSDDPEAMKKLRRASVGWDFTGYSQRPYIEQPLQTGSLIAFPNRIEYNAAIGRYELRYFSSWGIASAETVLFLDRSDLVAAFMKQ